MRQQRIKERRAFLLQNGAFLLAGGRLTAQVLAGERWPARPAGALSYVWEKPGTRKQSPKQSKCAAAPPQAEAVKAAYTTLFDTVVTGW